MTTFNTIRGGFSGVGGVLNTIGPKEAEYIGSTMAFAQASAPFRWTKVTTYNDYCIRIVSGAASSSAIGKDMSTVFANNSIYSPSVPVPMTVQPHTITTSEMFPHTHPVTVQPVPNNILKGGAGTRTILTAPGTPSTQGGTWAPSVASGSGHSHTAYASVNVSSPFNFAVKYVDVILATY
jgi:hypothetical protein